MNKPLCFTVTEELSGARLDRCLATLSERWTRSRVRRFMDEDLVRRNGAPARPADRVSTGDIIEVTEPEIRPTQMTAQDIPLSVIYEDEHLLVIDKPSGLVIHPAAGNPDGTLVNALLHYCTDLSGIGGVERPGIVHRIDKDTTGLLVVAKTDPAHLGLSLAFSRRQISKTYLAVCYGNLVQTEGVIDLPIDRHPVDRKRMAVRENGQAARTLYSVEEAFAGISLVSCRLITGRTHQIRVHLSHLGHALVGDPAYSGRQWRNLADHRHQVACREFSRQALHSWRLGFEHPVGGHAIMVEAPIPEDLRNLIDTLRV
ncbi:MAG: RluA family pseudouridine synthase [Thermoanaerobaculales bacterium]|nr:RluA family pseudouridine synthase [Thermoanaerobaculales bacterium]